MNMNHCARVLVFSFFLAGAVARAALAPDSVAGKVFRDSALTRVGPSLNVAERTVLLRPDGSFVYVKLGTGSALIFSAPNKVFLQTPRNDGTYVYTRTGEATGRITLTFDAFPLEAIDLEFATPSEGRTENATLHSTFWLSDAGAATTTPVANISLRGRVTPGRPLIAGFVIPGSAVAGGDVVPPPVGARQREVLIRVVGPSLAQFNVGDLWSDPAFELFRGSAPTSIPEVIYADWGVPPFGVPGDPAPAFRKIFNHLGAFPLTAGAKDAAAVVRLSPGNYTIVASASAADPGGEALIEVYFLP